MRVVASIVVLGLGLACGLGPDPVEPEAQTLSPSPLGPPVAAPAPGTAPRSTVPRAPGAPDLAPPPPLPVPTPPVVVRVKRASLERQLAGITGIGDLVGVRPNVTLSGIDGLVLTSIPAGSPVGGLGLRSGDIVHSINGQPLGTTLDLLGLVATLETATRFDGVLTRGGRTVHLQVNLD